MLQAVQPSLVHRGLEAYETTLAAMREYVATHALSAALVDQIWLVEHPPVFTLGLAGKPEHLLQPGEIPVLKVERGGQVTYHGPGQAVMYPLLCLRNYGLKVGAYVCLLEQCAIEVLARHGIQAERLKGAPGVYVGAHHAPWVGAKIAALGIKISRGMTFHGLALNVDMNLEPFERINPCGYAGLRVTDMRSLLPDPTSAPDFAALQQELAHTLQTKLRALT
jgi:lipoyl(octanoyl) transferase